MSQSFKPTESKSFFKGRQEELGLFEDMIYGRGSEWILHLPGPGGIGKTRLLEQMRDRCQSVPEAVVTKRMVDFFLPANQTAFGLMQGIATQLGTEQFRQFDEARKTYESILQHEPDPGERMDASKNVSEAFLSGLKQMLDLNYRIVLLFDTCEEMRGTEPWLLDSFLNDLLMLKTGPDLARAENEETLNEDEPFRVTVVIAGRKRIDFSSKPYAEYAVTRELKPFEFSEMLEYFRDGGIDQESIGDNELAQLHALSTGLPLYVALIFDWLRNDVGTVQELLSVQDNTPFNIKLISWIPQRLRNSQGRAILYTALAWRRMEPSLMSRMLEIELAEANQILRDLRSFSFVKYRPPSEEEHFSGSFQLHDEMRHLILTYIWPKEGLQTKEELLRIVVKWYEEIIDPELIKAIRLPDGTSGRLIDEERSLLIEYLYYTCQVNLAAAAKLHRSLFDNAIYYQDIGFAELLNLELERFRDSLPRENCDRLDNGKAVIALRRESFDIASRLWQRLLYQTDLDPELRAFILVRMSELRAYTGQSKDPAEDASQAIEIYEQLIEQASSEEEKRRLLGELAHAYNNRGFAHRTMNRLDEALSDYERALRLPCSPKYKAKILNNKGFVYFLKADLIKARTDVGKALKIRLELKIPYELGFGYNTMGIIMEHSGRFKEAADFYRRAFSEMKVARSQRGEAMVLLNQGRLARVINNFPDAEKHLTTARNISEKIKDNSTLIDALNELGCVYRERAEPDDLQKAKLAFQASLEMSRKHNNLHKQADNLEDMSLFYYNWGVLAKRQGNMTESDTLLNLAQENAILAGNIAKEREYSYIEAKSQRTLGELAFERGRFDEAFDMYLQSCVLTAQAVQAHQESQVLMRRRFEEMADRLQERLQQLDPEDTIAQINRLLPKLDQYPGELSDILAGARLYLDAALEQAKSFM